MLIFNLHHVEPEPVREDRKHISITPDGLRNMIRTFRALGFNIVSMREVLAAGGPAQMHDRDVLLTFDDGFINNLEHGAPVLEALKCPATIFALAGKFSGSNDWDHGHLPVEKRDPLMSLEQLKAVSDSGLISIGSHGMEHRPMSKLSVEDVCYEVQESYGILSSTLGESFVPVFAYPWGDFSDEAVAILEASPYELALTTEKERCAGMHSPYLTPRYSVYFRDGNPLIFASKLVRHGLLLG